MRPIATNKIKKILVTRTDRIGDVVLSTPIFQSIKEAFPQATVYALVLPTTCEIVEDNPYIDNVIVYDKRKKQKSFFQTIKFGLMLRKEKIDVAIHLHPTNRVYVISFVAGIPIRIGYRRRNSYRLLTHSLLEKKWMGEKHEAEYNYDLLTFLRIRQPQEIKPFFSVKQRHEQQLDAVLHERALSLRSFFVIFPSASCPSRRWPPQYFAQLADTLSQKYNLQTAIVGGDQDCAIVKDVVTHMKTPAINLVGQLTLKMLGALLQRSRMLISNDSGPVHIAASLHVPVISLFGRNDPGISPRRWHPLGKHSYFLHKDVGCIHCLAHNCEKGFKCLQSITVQDVLLMIENHFIPLFKSEQ